MMETILRSRLSKKELNTDVNTGINLVSKIKQISNVNDESIVDIDEVYLSELNSSKKYRLIFDINPVCSNVLFNAVTEVFYNEGAEDAKLIDSTAFDGLSAISSEGCTKKQCIRDTEYSNPKYGGLTYHPGADIFNNHILRQNGFANIHARTGSVNKEDVYTVSDRSGTLAPNPKRIDAFNTIFDLQRNQVGQNIEITTVDSAQTYANGQKKVKHAYQLDTIDSFESTMSDKLVEDNGWFGFYNASTLNVAIENGVYINKVLNGEDNRSGDFIDMFPDRTRFSFAPHMNKKQGNRIEKNWDYCLTYPYSSDKEHELVYDRYYKRSGLQFTCVSEYTTDTGKERYLILSVTAKHNLTVDSNVRMYCGDSQYDLKVRGLGDENGNLTEYFFSLDKDEIDLNIKDVGRFSKLVFGEPCEYYFRLFRRIPNFKEAGGYSDGLLGAIETYSDAAHDFDNEINKLAFSETAYGDDIVQIVYTDDIDLTGLTDNLGRPVTDIYLTIVKRNAGHDDYYSLAKNFQSALPGDYGKKVEWSSCFGKVTSGIEVPSGKYFTFDYNVRKLHNIDYNRLRTVCTQPWLNPKYEMDSLCFGSDAGETVESIWSGTNLPKFLEDDINIERGSFYGDIVEYSPLQVKETVIGDVYHRFNTLQREYLPSAWSDATFPGLKISDFDIMYDEIQSDDYDTSGFTATEKVYNSYFKTGNGSDTLVKFPGHLFPEGYYYKPHYKIHIADFNDTIAQSSDTQIEVSGVSLVDEYITFQTKASVANNVELVILKNVKPYNDIVYASVVGSEYDKTQEIWSVVAKPTSGTFDTTAEYKIFIKTEGIPDYAQRYPDNSGRYIWRGIKKSSEITAESELYGMPFANGAHYIYKGINFYLRRQDPDGTYGVNITEDKATALGYKNKNKLPKITRSSKTKPELGEALDYIKNSVFDIC